MTVGAHVLCDKLGKFIYKLPLFCDGEHVLWKFSAFSNFRNKKMCHLPLYKKCSQFLLKLWKG